MNLMEVVGKRMIEHQVKGSIVNISSQASMRALEGHLAYCASKAGLDSATRSMAQKLGPHGIRVNSIHPTITDTELSRKAWANPVKLAAALERVPLGRMCNPSEIADLVVFLLSDRSSMITGARMVIDGGFTAVF